MRLCVVFCVRVSSDASSSLSARASPLKVVVAEKEE